MVFDIYEPLVIITMGTIAHIIKTEKNLYESRQTQGRIPLAFTFTFREMLFNNFRVTFEKNEPTVDVGINMKTNTQGIYEG